jgi:hypothetical protein
LARLTRVVEVEHRGHRIHAQPVDVILVEPEERVAGEEIPHLIAPEIKDERAPILMLALPRIHVLVEIRPVELREPMRIFRKVRRHPIHDHADARAMAPVDEIAQLIGFPKRLVGA